jgi:hypothetical protein
MSISVLTLAAFNTLATDVAELGQFVREADSVAKHLKVTVTQTQMPQTPETCA